MRSVDRSTTSRGVAQIVGRGVRVGERDLEVGADHGQRVAQLVRRLLDELALALEGLVEAAEHVVEGVGQLVELVVGPARSMRRDRSVAWISPATAVMRPIGLRTRPATTQPTPRLATKRISSALSE